MNNNNVHINRPMCRKMGGQKTELMNVNQRPLAHIVYLHDLSRHLVTGDCGNEPWLNCSWNVAHLHLMSLYERITFAMSVAHDPSNDTI